MAFALPWQPCRNGKVPAVRKGHPSRMRRSLIADAAAALIVGLVLALLLAPIDLAMLRAGKPDAPGALACLWQVFGDCFLRPGTVLPAIGLTWLTFGGTYATANAVRTICEENRWQPALYVWLCTTTVQCVIMCLKDAFLTGGIAPPFDAVVVWVARDLDVLCNMWSAEAATAANFYLRAGHSYVHPSVACFAPGCCHQECSPDCRRGCHGSTGSCFDRPCCHFAWSINCSSEHAFALQISFAYGEQSDLTFSWVIPYQAPLWRYKPAQYIRHLLGHEGKGSVIAALKQQGLIVGCGAGDGGWLETSFSLLNVTFELTDKGLDAVEEIGRYLFAYLGMPRS
eukprot:g8960.t1